MNTPTIPDLVTHLDPRNCGLTVQLSEQAAVEINARHRERMAEREEQLAQALNRAAELQDMLLKEKQWLAKLVRAVADERKEQLAKAVTECEEARAELAAMREAIKEAHAALQNRVNSEGCSCEGEWPSPHIRARHSAACNATKSALAKLQPFIK